MNNKNHIKSTVSVDIIPCCGCGKIYIGETSESKGNSATEVRTHFL